jgi:hypothetical protein
MCYVFSLKNGDSGTKRAKVDLDSEGEIIIEPHLTRENVCKGEEIQTTTQSENNEASIENNEASTSSAAPPAPGIHDSSVDQLPKEMHDMKIRDAKADDPCEKVGLHIFTYICCYVNRHSMRHSVVINCFLLRRLRVQW